MDKLKTPILQSHFMSNEKKSEMSARGSVNRIDSKVLVKFLSNIMTYSQINRRILKLWRKEKVQFQ